MYLFLGPAFATNEESLSSQAPKTVSFERWVPPSSSGSTGAASCLKAVADRHARMQVFPLAVPTDTHPCAVIAVPRLLSGTACVPACSLRVLHTLHFQPPALPCNSKSGRRLLCLNMRPIPLASLAVVAYRPWPMHSVCGPQTALASRFLIVASTSGPGSTARDADTAPGIPGVPVVAETTLILVRPSARCSVPASFARWAC